MPRSAKARCWCTADWVGGEDIARWLTELPHAGQFRGHLCRSRLIADSGCRRFDVAVAALIAAGFGLTLVIFYPGVMTYDAKFVYEDIAKGELGDWQSPVMTVLWALIDPIAPGSAQHVPADRDLYWLAFGAAGVHAGAPRQPWLALLLPLLALTAAGLRLCRDHLARRAVRDQLAARRRARLRRRRA